MNGPNIKPRVWALLGRRTGDNLQVEALAEALGWPWERKRLVWRSPSKRWTPLYGRMGPSLAPLTAEARAELAGPPWPDLVLSVGWRSAPVARWIGRECGAKLAHIGRPRTPLSAFDLVLTPPQYPLPEVENVVRLGGPLTRLSPQRLASAAERWRDRFSPLPRPWIAVLIGGDARPYRLTPEAAAELGDRATALARERSGSLLVATGPRTPAAAAEAFLSRVGAPFFAHLWGGAGENPYLGFLALADAFIVTSDSVSMAHEASLTGRPLHIFDTPEKRPPLLRIKRWVDQRARAGGGAPARAYLGLVRSGWLYPPRRTDAFQAELLRSGRATRLGDPAPPPRDEEAPKDLERAVAAIRAIRSSPAS